MESFQNFLSNHEKVREIVNSGYHFIDIPIGSPRKLRLRGGAGEVVRRIKGYLTELSSPSGLLGQGELSYLDDEPIAILDMDLTPVAAGGKSDFLPQAYIDLYEPGSII